MTEVVAVGDDVICSVVVVICSVVVVICSVVVVICSVVVVVCSVVDGVVDDGVLSAVVPPVEDAKTTET